MKTYIFLALIFFNSFSSICQESPYISRIQYTMDILDRVYIHENIEKLCLSVYFKNEDNGQVNIGYISPAVLFEIQHDKDLSRNVYQNYYLSTAKQFLYDTVFYNMDSKKHFVKYFVDEKIYDQIRKMPISEIKAKYFNGNKYTVKDQNLQLAILLFRPVTFSHLF